MDEKINEIFFSSINLPYKIFLFNFFYANLIHLNSIKNFERILNFQINQDLNFHVITVTHKNSSKIFFYSKKIFYWEKFLFAKYLNYSSLKKRDEDSHQELLLFRGFKWKESDKHIKINLAVYEKN